MTVQSSRIFYLSGAIILTFIISLLWLLSNMNQGFGQTENLLIKEHDETKAAPEVHTDEVLTGNRSPLKMDQLIDWKSVDLMNEPLPKQVASDAKFVQITQHRLHLQNYEVFYREATPPPQVEPSHRDVLLLHGMRFKSQTWLELNTIQLLAAMGHKVVAIDIPGYGESSKEHVPEGDRGEFLHKLISSLQLKQPVVVSPSLSGSFTVPLLSSHPEQFGGYVPVAPIKTGMLTHQQYKNIKIPTLIIYGDKDKDLGKESTDNLGNIPTSQVRVLPNAGHPAYLDQPVMFHQLLYNFIKLAHKSQP